MYRGPVRLREVHVASSDRRTGCSDFGAGPHRQQTRERAWYGPHAHISGIGPVPLAHGRPERRIRHEDERVPKTERREKVQYYLHLVHLAQFKDSYPHQLSGGMRQRVALARALAAEPDVLLMDEPFAALDAQTRDLLHDELERIWSETGRTIIFITHNVREAIRLGDRVALMTFRPGRVKREYAIELTRPRQLEDIALATTASEILRDLREEIDKSLDAQYSQAAKPEQVRP